MQNGKNSLHMGTSKCIDSVIMSVFNACEVEKVNLVFINNQLRRIAFFYVQYITNT